MQNSIVLPVYNQADHLDRVVRDYVRHLGAAAQQFELILVPNGCRDHSQDVCNALAQEFPCVRVEPAPAAGWGHAVRWGLSKANGELLGYTNLARTAGDDLVRTLQSAHSNPHAVVKANRKIRDSAYRRLGSLLYNLECRALFDLPYWDINGTPKLFRRSHLKLLDLRRDDDLIDLEFLVVCRREGYTVVELPILSGTRHGGSSTTTLRSVWRLYSRAWALRHGAF